MIKELRKIPDSGKSHPMNSAEYHCHLKSSGYAEDEYLMTGTANIYTENEDRRVSVIFPEAPYTTRLLVRRPAEVTAFSGNVVLEILNSTAMTDIDRMWINAWPYLMRNGDIYIGITSKGHVVDALKCFDPQRYAKINWANPLPGRRRPERTSSVLKFLPQFESGLFWDMLMDLAGLLRSDTPDNPVSRYHPDFLYLTGWSQSGSYVTRIVKSFACLPENRPGGKPLFDGYLAAGCGADVAPVNAYELRDKEMLRPERIPAQSVMGAEVPYININTESENRAVNWHGDSDDPGSRFRVYEIPASSHDSFYNLIGYYEGQGQEDQIKAGVPLAYDGLEEIPLDSAYEMVFSAAFRNLYGWVRKGIPAPHAPKIETEFTSRPMEEAFGAAVKNKTDLFGNAQGGIRLPAVECPIYTYHSASRRKGGGLNPLFGWMEPFGKDRFRAVYGTEAQYEKILTEKTAAACAAGFLLKEDIQAYEDFFLKKLQEW